jgi:hypothetical protein
LSLAGAVAPRLTDRFMERNTFEAQETNRAVADGRPDNLHQPVEHDGGERGRNWSGRVRGTSVYTAAALRPGVAAAVAATLVGATLASVALRRRS